MYGLVNRAVRDLVITQFGEAKWTAVDFDENCEQQTIRGLLKETNYVVMGRLRELETSIYSPFSDAASFETTAISLDSSIVKPDEFAQLHEWVQASGNSQYSLLFRASVDGLHRAPFIRNAMERVKHWSL